MKVKTRFQIVEKTLKIVIQLLLSSTKDKYHFKIVEKLQNIKLHNSGVERA
jgi:hypothetical protein